MKISSQLTDRGFATRKALQALAVLALRERSMHEQAGFQLREGVRARRRQLREYQRERASRDKELCDIAERLDRLESLMQSCHGRKC